MAECDRFGELLERRLSGALPEAEAGPLDEHLAGCPACRDYLAVAARVERELVARLEGVPALPIEAVRARVELIQAQLRRGERSLRLAIFGSLLLPVVPLALSHSLWGGWDWQGGLGTLMVLPMFLGAWGWLRYRRHQDETQLARGELLAVVRRNLDRSLRGTRRVRWLLPTIGIGVIALGFGDPTSDWLIRSLTLTEGLAMIGMSVWLARRLPQLEREWEALQ